jgi:hypothetical protein
MLVQLYLNLFYGYNVIIYLYVETYALSHKKEMVII